MQDAAPLSQEAEHQLRCYCYNTCVSLCSPGLGEVFEKLRGASSFCLTRIPPACFPGKLVAHQLQ